MDNNIDALRQNTNEFFGRAESFGRNYVCEYKHWSQKAKDAGDDYLMKACLESAKEIEDIFLRVDQERYAHHVLQYLVAFVKDAHDLCDRDEEFMTTTISMLIEIAWVLDPIRDHGLIENESIKWLFRYRKKIMNAGK